MATRNIKDAKDLSTNELIYFKGHAKATYMSDGRTVEDAINSSVGSDENTPLKFVFDEDTNTYSIVSINDFGNYTWNLPSMGGSLVKTSDVMYKLECYVVGYLPEIYACANGEIDSTLFDKGPIGSEGILPIVSADATYVAGIVSGMAYNEDDTITFSIYTYDGKCIVITTSYSDDYIYTDEIRIIDLTNTGGGDCNIPVSTTTSTSISLSPNRYYRWTNTPSSITITLATPSDSTILNNYMFEFTASSSGTTLTMPSTIKWLNGSTPTIDNGKTYQISIINNLATISKFG